MSTPAPEFRYPLPDDPKQAVRMLMNGIVDMQQAIAALKQQQTSSPSGTSSTSSTGVVVSELSGSSIAKQANEWLDSFDANTGQFTASQPAAANLSDGTVGTGAVVLASALPTVPTFVDDEVVSGSGTSWTLANTPSPVASLELFVIIVGYGGVLLDRGSVTAEGYSITGAAITTVTSYSAGVLRAWYRR